MVFRKWQKSLGKKPASRYWKTKEMKMIGWCMKKNIFISTSPDWKDDLNRWIIHIKINNKTHDDPKRYNDKEAIEKVCEYYKYYYDRYKK